MPLEGHWQRQHTPLRGVSPRELRVLAVVLVVLGVAVGIAVYAAIDHGAARTAAGCVDVSVPSTTGAATLHACGADAKRWCHSQAARDDAASRPVVDACARAGYR